MHEMLDPPAFTPKGAGPVRDGDSSQELTYATGAQFPLPVGTDTFEWLDGTGANLRYAYGETRRLVIANRGVDEQGFTVCEDCGAAWLTGDEPSSGKHERPFLLSRHTERREGVTRYCQGNLRRGLILAHDFSTDLLLLQVAFDESMDFDPRHSWLYDALATLAEGLQRSAVG
jgi:hypothetical protein